VHDDVVVQNSARLTTSVFAAAGRWRRTIAGPICNPFGTLTAIVWYATRVGEETRHVLVLSSSAMLAVALQIALSRTTSSGPLCRNLVQRLYVQLDDRL